MTARDRKLAMVLAPLAAFALYWMLLLNPALDRKSALAEPLAQAQTERDAAIARAAEVTEAKQNYESDFAELVELSKAIPQNVAVSALMRELNVAAKGTGIDFTKITMGAQAAGPKEKEADVPPPSPAGSAPVAVSAVDGLEQIPVELTFDGRFFELSDLFSRVQKFVRVANGKVDVNGRLISIDSFSFTSATFPSITAQINATIYAAPAAEGPTDGATPAGPKGAQRGDGDLKPVGNFSNAAVVHP